MDPSSTAPITEFAIVVAGFTGLVLALGPQEGRTNPLVKLRTVTMLFYAFTAAFGSLLPTLWQSFGVEAMWHYSSYILVVLLLANMAATFVSSRVLLTSQERAHLAIWMWLLVMVGNTLFAIILVAALTGLFGIAVEGAFICALIWQLVLSSILFTRLILQG